MRTIVPLGCCLTLGACASSSVLDMASDTIQVSTSAAPACGQSGAQAVAQKRAAIETLKRGYDSYLIVGADAQDNVRVVGTTPVIANTQTTGMINSYGNNATYSGHSSTYLSGGYPIIGGHHDQSLVIRMFKHGDVGSERAIDAKVALGPDWQKEMEAGNRGTCY